MIQIPENNYNHTVETTHGPAIISIPETADMDDILQIKEHLDVVIKHHFHMNLQQEKEK